MIIDTTPFSVLVIGFHLVLIPIRGDVYNLYPTQVIALIY